MLQEQPEVHVTELQKEKKRLATCPKDQVERLSDSDNSLDQEERLATNPQDQVERLSYIPPDQVERLSYIPLDQDEAGN